jgi:hypothetical protein
MDMNCKMIIDTLKKDALKNWECEKIQGEHDRLLIISDFLYPNNDCIEILLEKYNSGYLISDLCETYNYLFSSGLDIADTSNRNKYNLVRQIARNLGVIFENYELRYHVRSLEKLSESINLLIQVIIQIANLENLQKPYQPTVFKDRLYAFFVAKNSLVEMDYLIEGFAKQKHKFDIRLNGTKELLGKAISTKSSQTVQISIERAYYAFDDILKTNRKFEKAIFYDDTRSQYREAWKEDHFKQLIKDEIPYYAFERDKFKIAEIAIHHPFFKEIKAF